MVTNIRKKSNKKHAPMCEMNVTPLIDVMLVLLVIFMVTAPLMTIGVKVNLPNASSPTVNGNDIPIIVSIDANGKVFIGDVEIELDNIGEKLKAITAESKSRIFVRGDKDLFYGKIMSVMGAISNAGFHHVVLVTDLPNNKQQRNVKKSK